LDIALLKTRAYKLHCIFEENYAPSQLFFLYLFFLSFDYFFMFSDRRVLCYLASISSVAHFYCVLNMP